MAHDKDSMEAPGVFTLAMIFLAVFIVVWFMHFKWLGNLWMLG